MKLLQFLCNLPWTLLGVLLTLSCGIDSSRREKDALVVVVQRLWFLNKFFCGFTLGRIIVVKAGYDSKELIAHEYVHVEQYDRYWGLFPILYLRENGLFKNTRVAWSQNRFEQEACEVANERLIESEALRVERLAAKNAEGDKGVEGIESAHFILTLNKENLARFNNPYDWLAKLDRIYESYAELVGGVPSSGQRIEIVEHGPEEQCFGFAWIYPGEPYIHWCPDVIPVAIQEINKGNWSFGIAHEIGHLFDNVRDDKAIDTWVWHAEFSANFKMVYVLGQIPEMVVWNDRPDGTRWGTPPYYPYVKEMYEKKAREQRQFSMALITKPEDLQGPFNDAHTFHFIELAERVGWEPFKAAYRTLNAIPRKRLPQDNPMARFTLFMETLARYADTQDFDTKQFLRERGFPC